ncbi:hypothetical protein FHS95_000214 [Sphingomonas naasensis]|uniref:PilZ domain-containing protein n=1 Tax=Sphingomonas naasensis TaxID=1344951 RepID=A0A4S1WW16_9SPHN|nr:PilZ domain-containing protein [Sphingomonas naasensis]NIJ18545.1 hypothetical protein [Sphingomonas naasensis]TGX45796.1 PilZ domain-containing protein [Sphingomonas naasensis]
MAIAPKSAPFAAEFAPADTPGQRRSVRAPVSLDARIGRDGLGRALCKVVDLSVRGARLQTYSELRVGAMIWLALPRIGPRAARIVWVHDFEAGLEFERPLTPQAFEALTAQ